MCDIDSCLCHSFSMDSKTPLNLHLSGYFKRSFAFQTIKDRMPVILTKVIDHLVRDKEQIIELCGGNAKEELKTVIGEISKLKYEIQTNKPLLPFNSPLSDTKVYDWYLSEQSTTDGEPRYFTTIWLHAECYMYRRLQYFFENTKSLNKFDPFRKQKQVAFHDSLDAITALCDHLMPLVINPKKGMNLKAEFIRLLKLSLWGNRCDISISGGENNSQTSDPLEMVDKFEQFILSDQSDRIWKTVSNPHSKARVIEIINDNAGFEIFTDFCLADFLISHRYAEAIIFNFKTIPWFISDMTIPDFRWIIRQLIKSENTTLKKFGIRWNKYIRENTWIVLEDDFWVYPMDFSYMKGHKPELYYRLVDAKIAIFKGDLNYRKLFGEKNWEPTTSLQVALQGFEPTSICSLRTIKADIVCGLKKGVAENLDATDPTWMTTGNYGLIQFWDCGC